MRRYFDERELRSWFFGIALGLAAAVWVLTMPACQSSSRIEPGRTTIQRTDSVTHRPDGSVIRETKVGGEAIGPAASASGDKVSQDATGKPADIDLGGIGSGTGGGFNISTTAAGGLGSNPLVWAGMLCIVGAGVCVYLGLRGAAIACAGTGAVLLVVGFYPALLLWGLALCVAGLAGYLVWASRQGKNTAEALRAVVAGVEGASKEAAAAVKAEISKHADSADKATIATIKVKDNL